MGANLKPPMGCWSPLRYLIDCPQDKTLPLARNYPWMQKSRLQVFSDFSFGSLKRINMTRDVYNTDETPMLFGMVGNITLTTAGTSTVLILTNGAENRGFTAVLTVADGQMLKPTIIFKGV